MANSSKQGTLNRLVNNTFTSTKVLQLLIVISILAITLVVSSTIGISNNKIVMIALGLPVATCAIIFMLKNMEKAPVMIIFVAGFIPFGLSTGTESKIMASLIVTLLFVGIWVISMLIGERRLTLTPSMINLPVLAFIAVVLIAWLWSLIFRDPLVRITSTFPLVQLASTLVMVLLPFSALLVGNLVKDEKTLRWMVGLILLIVGVDLVIRFTGHNFPIDANGITHMWAITFAVSMAAFLKGLNRLQQGLLLALVIASVVWGFVLHLSWYSGWVPGFICIGVIAVIKSKKLFIALVLGLVLVVFLNRGYFLDNLAFKQTNDAVTRWAAWQINWQVTSQHLLFGTGPGGYAAYYMTYFPSTGMATHNNYIDIIAETGITGLMLYFWLFISLLILGYRIIRRVRGRGDFIESMSIGVFSGTIGCIVIMAFGDWMIPFAYTQTIAGYNYEVYSWLFLGTLIVLDRLTKNLKPPETALNLTV